MEPPRFRKNFNPPQFAYFWMLKIYAHFIAISVWYIKSIISNILFLRKFS